jgi:DNA-nicking Smr family endonuclease
MGRKKSEGFNSPFARLGGSKKSATPEAPVPPPKPPPPPVEDDAELFRRAMAGVRSVPKPTVRVEPAKTLEPRLPDDETLALQEFESFARGETPFELSDSEELQYGLAPGVTQETLRSLQKGDFAFRRHLDLHGLDREAAHAAIIEFIITSRKSGERCVLIVTGRGKGSPAGISVLKETLPRWLSRAPVRAHVLAFCTATGVHGGPGAFYVLLRRQGVRPF